MPAFHPSPVHALLACAWLACGCAVEATGSAPMPPSVEDGGAEASTGVDVAAPPATDAASADGSLPAEAGADGSEPTGQVDPDDPPRIASACGDDLDADNGRVRPDLGTLPAPSAFAGNPEQAGPYQVLEEPTSIPIPAGTLEGAGMRIELTGGTLAGTAYLPSTDGSGPAVGPFPLVLVLPGFQASYTLYAHFSRHFASHGFVAVGFDTRSEATVASHDTEAAEVSRALDFLLSPSFAHWARIDGSKVAVAGHSKGGKVAFFAAALDARVDQVIAWDPQNAGGPPCFVDPSACHNFPVAPNCGAEMAGVAGAGGILHYVRAASLVLGVPPDPLITPDPDHNAVHFYRGAPSPAELVVLDDGHAAWLEPPTGSEAVARISKAVQVATLRARFGAQTGLDTWRPGGSYLDAEPHVTAVHTK